MAAMPQLRLHGGPILMIFATVTSGFPSFHVRKQLSKCRQNRQDLTPKINDLGCFSLQAASFSTVWYI